MTALWNECVGEYDQHRVSVLLCVERQVSGAACGGVEAASMAGFLLTLRYLCRNIKVLNKRCYWRNFDRMQ